MIKSVSEAEIADCPMGRLASGGARSFCILSLKTMFDGFVVKYRKWM